MYTQRRGEEGRFIPQNYSGNAFRYPPIGGPISEGEAVGRDENKAPSLLPPVKETEETVPSRQQDAAPEHTAGEILPVGRREGWGSEEFLLLGLCFLLSGDGTSIFGRSGGWGDVLPYLLLLLFLG